MKVTCASCGVSLKAKDELAGKTAKCPKCGNPIEIPKPTPPDVKLTPPDAKPKAIPLATERQKDYATSLGVNFPADINRKDISDLIDIAVEKRTDQRSKELDELSNRKSKAWYEMREEILTEIDEDDCPLSRAKPAQMLEELSSRNRGAILISFDWEDDIDFEDLTDVEFSVASSDEMEEAEVRTVLSWVGFAIMRQSKQ